MSSRRSLDREIIRKSFGWVKKNLDPSRSYIIFENDLNKQASSIFADSLVAYGYLDRENYVWKKVFDSEISKEYLVIQIDPGDEDATLGRLMGYGFPGDVVYYVFKAENFRY